MYVHTSIVLEHQFYSVQLGTLKIFISTLIVEIFLYVFKEAFSYVLPNIKYAHDFV